MQYGYLRTKMKSLINDGRLVMHGIAQVTFFLNGLLLVAMVGGCVNRAGSFNQKVLVGINNILAGNKADKQ
jgi:hypothetical protein